MRFCNPLCPPISLSVGQLVMLSFFGFWGHFWHYCFFPKIWLAFLGSSPKGPLSGRTQGWTSTHPSIHLSIHPSVNQSPPKVLGPSPAYWGLKSRLFSLKSVLTGLKSSLSGLEPPCRSLMQPPNLFPGCMQIHPSVLLDISYLGPLPCSHLTSPKHPKKGNGCRWSCAGLRCFVYHCSGPPAMWWRFGSG